MLTYPQIEEISGTLLEAENGRFQVEQFVNSYPGMTEEDGYAVQMSVLPRRLGQGRVIVGKKVALTNTAVQQALGVHEPVFGHLTSDMFVKEGQPISCASIPQPKIEPEIAFVMKSDLSGPGVTPARVLAATAGVMPALEIPAPRIKDWKFAVPDMAADNAFAARVVVGGTLTPVEGIDLRLVGVMFERNGQLISTGAGAAAYGNPVDVVAWLANKLAEHGTGLNAGDIVLPGALVVAPDVHPGEYYRATFAYLGSVSAYFVE